MGGVCGLIRQYAGNLTKVILNVEVISKKYNECLKWCCMAVVSSCCEVFYSLKKRA